MGKGQKQGKNAKILSFESSNFFGGVELDFQGMGVYPSDGMSGPGEGVPARPWLIVGMSPPSYPSAWLLPSRARFRFTW
jgi:hypothetical protein